MFAIGIIVAGILIGKALKWSEVQGKISPSVPLPNILKINLKIVMLGMNPIIIIGVFWHVQLGDMKLIYLPILGIFALILGGLLAIWAAKLQKLDKMKTGSMFVSGSFTNMGSFGTLFCFVLLGEESLVFVAMFRLLEEFVYYTVGFPIAKAYGVEDTPQSKRKKVFMKLITDPFILASFLAIVVGAALNLFAWDRPLFYANVIAVLVPLATLIMVISIGYNMKLKAIQGYLKECFSISVVKFILVPIVMVAIAYFVGLGDLYDGMVLKVIIILCCMPPAFTSLIPPQLYKLDTDLANSSWIFNTGLLIFILPLLYLIIGNM